jgi:cytochrome oxidase Cu insertion factor (SCO1/SenC/PrrC family)
MNLDALPRTPAPGFTLTDQAGRTMNLADFRGKAVVLEFLDPHCTDICPIVSQEFVDAYHDLGPAAGKVVFIGINVNPYHTRVADVHACSTEQRLTTIPDWHYFTGPVPQLQPAWHDYNIYVQAPNPSADVVHTSAVYFIDPRGRERYLASPRSTTTSQGPHTSRRTRSPPGATESPPSPAPSPGNPTNGTGPVVFRNCVATFEPRCYSRQGADPGSRCPGKTRATPDPPDSPWRHPGPRRLAAMSSAATVYQRTAVRGTGRSAGVTWRSVT